MSDIIVPSNQNDLKLINGVMKELSNSKTRAQGETDYQKEALEELQDKFGIKVKHLRRMANDFHKNEYDKKVEESVEYQQLYESVFETNFAADPGDEE
jgi:hypothetical protein